MISLQRRLGLAIAASVLAAVSVSLLAGAYLVRRSIEHAALNGLRRQVALLANEDLRPSPGPLGRFLTTQDERLSVLPRRQARLLLPDSPAGRITVNGHDYLYATRWTDADVVVLLRTASSVRSDSRPFWFALAAAGALGCLLAAAVAAALARGIARPVVRVARASSRLAAGESPQPLPVSGSLELRALAESFNTMADQLRRAREAERSFLLSVSHELKTPLTAIRGYAEALEEGVLTPDRAVKVIRTEAERLERLIADLLHLARLDRQRFDIRPTTVDLAEIARESASRHAARARELGVQLELQRESAAPASADPDRHGHRSGNRGRGNPARVRTLLSLPPLQRAPSGRHRSRTRDRPRAGSGDGRRRRGGKPSRRGYRFHDPTSASGGRDSTAGWDDVRDVGGLRPRAHAAVAQTCPARRNLLHQDDLFGLPGAIVIRDDKSHGEPCAAALGPDAACEVGAAHV